MKKLRLKRSLLVLMGLGMSVALSACGGSSGGGGSSSTPTPVPVPQPSDHGNVPLNNTLFSYHKVGFEFTCNQKPCESEYTPAKLIDPHHPNPGPQEKFWIDTDLHGASGAVQTYQSHKEPSGSSVYRVVTIFKGDIEDTQNSLSFPVLDSASSPDQKRVLYVPILTGNIDVQSFQVVPNTAPILLGVNVKTTQGVQVQSGGDLWATGVVSGQLENSGNLVVIQSPKANEHLSLDHNAYDWIFEGTSFTVPDFEESSLEGVTGLQVNGSYIQNKGSYLYLGAQSVSQNQFIHAFASPKGSALYVNGPVMFEGGAIMVPYPQQSTDQGKKKSEWVPAIISSEAIQGSVDSVSFLSDRLRLIQTSLRSVHFQYDGHTYYGLVYNADMSKNQAYFSLISDLEKTQTDFDYFYKTILPKLLSSPFVDQTKATTGQALETAWQTMQNQKDKQFVYNDEPVTLSGDLQITAKGNNGLVLSQPIESQGDSLHTLTLSGPAVDKEGADSPFYVMMLGRNHVNLTLSNVSFEPQATIDGNVQIQNKVELTSQFSALYQLSPDAAVNRYQFRLGLIIGGDLTLEKESTLSLSSLSIYVKGNFNPEKSSQIILYQSSFRNLPGKYVMMVFDKKPTHSPTIQFDRDPHKQAVSSSYVQIDGKTALVVTLPDAKEPAEGHPIARAAQPVQARSVNANVDRVMAAGQGKTITVLGKDEDKCITPVTMTIPTALSSYASALPGSAQMQNELQGAEFSTALSVSNRIRNWESNNNALALIHHADMHGYQVNADVAYIKLHEGGHVDRTVLSLVGRLPYGVGRIALSRNDSFYNASYGVEGLPTMAKSRSTAYGIHVAVSQSVDALMSQKSLTGLSLQLETDYLHVHNKVMRAPVKGAVEDSYNQNTLQFGLTLARETALPYQLSLTPLIGYRFAYTDQAAFAEYLSPYKVKLVVPSQHLVNHVGVVGLSLQWHRQLPAVYQLSAHIDALYNHRFNKPRFEALVQGGAQKAFLTFKNDVRSSLQLRLGLDCQYGALEAGVQTELFYNKGMNAQFGAHLGYHF